MDKMEPSDVELQDVRRRFCGTHFTDHIAHEKYSVSF